MDIAIIRSQDKSLYTVQYSLITSCQKFEITEDRADIEILKLRGIIVQRESHKL